MKNHMHEYVFDSEFNKEHTHNLAGYTEAKFGFGFFHFHYYQGVSSSSDHTHRFKGFTGFAVKTKNGHVHYLKNVLSRCNRHDHKFNGQTSEEISYLPDGFIREMLI